MPTTAPLFPLMRFVRRKGRIFPYFRISGGGAKETAVDSLQNLEEVEIVAKRYDPVFLEEYHGLFKEAVALRAHSIAMGQGRQIGVIEAALAANVPVSLIMEGIEAGIARAKEEKNS